MKKYFAIVATFSLFPLFLARSSAGEFDYTTAVKKIEARFEPADAKPGQQVTLKVAVELNEGYYTYAIHQPDPSASQATKIDLPKSDDVFFYPPINDPPNFLTKSDGMDLIRYYPEGTIWELKGVVPQSAKPGTKTVHLEKLTLVICFHIGMKEGCLRPKAFPVSAELTVLDGPAIPIDPKIEEEIRKSRGAPIPIQAKPADPREKKNVALRIPGNADYAADMKLVEEMIPKQNTGNAGFIALVLTAMFWGAVTLLTPCVFPMVPITVSYFLKQGEKKLHNPLMMATVYTLTILLVLGLAARFAVGVFKVLSVDPFMNVALGILFVVFAMSLFGMFDIALPSFLIRFTSQRERGGGYLGTIFMALSFSIVSFTCVAPFLGGFSGMVASGNFSEAQLFAGAFAFAATFAAPFFLLALFPTFLKKLPKSGGWMNTIKVVMGFLEVAAALKFFRTAELRWQIPPNIFTYDFVLSMWVVLLFLCGMYLINLYRLPHDEPQEHIGVTRMMFGFLVLSVGVYLLPGLFSSGKNEKQRPTGTLYAWVDAFLLPEPSAAEVVSGNGLVWSADLKRSIDDARAKGEYIFVDFTGVTCSNCKLNERQVFTKPEVQELLKQYRLVQLYTDTVPPEFYESFPDPKQQDADAKINSRFQESRFGTIQLPVYVVLKPVPGSTAVEVVARYDEGKINNEAAFMSFLRTSLTK